jgi:two-component system KDP operon response regulator KdpE
MTENAHGRRVLIVDDEPAIRRLLRTILTAQGYRTVEVETGHAALSVLARDRIDVLVLDLGLPDIDGLEVLKRTRCGGSNVPVVVLSSRTDETGKVHALDMGADDYVTKPFGIEELLARIRTALRHRLQPGGQRTFRSRDLVVDLERRIVSVNGREIKLTPTEYELLRLFAMHAGKVLTHRFLLRELWGAEADVQYLRIYIRSVRRKIESDPGQPQHILTEQGVGYRLRTAD